MRLKQYESDFDKLLRKERIKRQTRLVGNEIQIKLGDSDIGEVRTTGTGVEENTVTGATRMIPRFMRMDTQSLA